MKDHKTIKISDFKAKCIEALKTVHATGEPLTVTLRDAPIATIHPYSEQMPQPKLGALRGRMTWSTDMVADGTGDDWEMEQE